MNSGRLILRGLTHYVRIHLAVALGVAAATAVLTGALLVGDSVRGSLRAITLDRLGKIDQLLVSDRFFTTDMVRRLSRGDRFPANFNLATAAIVLPQATVEARRDEGTERASEVLALGVVDEFWKFGPEGVRPPARTPGEGEVILNEPLARELGVQAGDEVVLRIPKANQVPADSALGKKTETIRSLTQLKVIEVLPAAGLGRFSLHPSQHVPRNAYLALSTLQEALNVAGRANAILVQELESDPLPVDSALLTRLLSPTLDDLGLKISHVRRTYEPNEGEVRTAFEYYQLSSDRLLLDDVVSAAARQAWGERAPQPVFTYLANSIARVAENEASSEPDEKDRGVARGSGATNAVPRAEVPYSTVCAVDSAAPLGPLLDEQGRPLPPLAEDQIVLNAWTAEQLGAKVGDRIRLKFFEPETTHGETVERSAEFRLLAIVPLVEPFEGFRLGDPARFRERPSPTNDSDLTPTVEGITDQESISRWDPPFPYDSRRVKPADDEYWANHRTTPKAFVSLAAGQNLWRSRFGRVTSWRVPAGEGVDEAQLGRELMNELRRRGATVGLEFQPIKRRSLAASSGTTPFDALFLSLSFFLIAAAVMLVALLFRLGIEQRANEIGVLLATGWTPDRVNRSFLGEGVVVAACGGMAGVAIGAGYAWLLLAGLRTWWIGAVSTPQLELHVTFRSLAIGGVSGLVIGAIVTWFSLRQTRRMPIRQLLSGRFGVPAADAASVGWFARLFTSRRVAVASAVGSLGLTALATQLGGEAQAGAFVGAGLGILGALLLSINAFLRGAGGAAEASRPLAGLGALAARNAARNPGRSAATIGLVGAAVYLIVALSAFRLAPTEAGSGGFALVGQSTQAVLQDLNSPTVRDDLFAGDAEALEGVDIVPFRLRPGDDASCTNLYQARQPRVLGVGPRLVEHFDRPGTTGFAWAGSAATTDEQRKNPWRLLRRDPVSSREPGDEPPIPVVLDKNTALYGLHLYGGIGQEFEIPFDDDRTLRFRVVGLLANSVLQGALVIDEAEFLRHFPLVSGERYFLIDAPPERAVDVERLLEDRLSDQGLDVRRSRDILEDFLAVQNTYLSTFQSLGALGLLLGTFGLATVQVRSVVERRGELALLRAAGFSRRRLARLVLSEHVLLLLGGMSVGLIGALVAVLPHWLTGGASVPWRELGPMLLTVLAVGLAAGAAAIRAALRAPLIGSLRGD